MRYEYDDGGRAAAGYRGRTGDCVVRAVAIASGRPYGEVYRRCADGNGAERKSKGRSARNGVSVTRLWFKRYMAELGAVWTPTMHIGVGCRVHLTHGELPDGRLVVSVSRHYTAVVDQVIRDTHDPRRRADVIFHPDGMRTAYGGRCVYGYWTFPALAK